MIRRQIISAAFVLAVVVNTGLVQAKPNTVNATTDAAARIRHQISTLPYTGIWDWIEAELRPDGSVVLRGSVMRPSTKSDAESRLRGLESVSNVVNDIRVLPLSQFDNDLRVRVYRSLFNANSSLLRYGFGANPSIHIIIENGKVTLKGAVSNAMDKQLATFAVNSVFGVMNVDNQLESES